MTFEKYAISGNLDAISILQHMQQLFNCLHVCTLNFIYLQLSIHIIIFTLHSSSSPLLILFSILLDIQKIREWCLD